MDQPVAPVAVAKLPLKDRMKLLAEEYGPVAMGTYLVISLIIVASFAVAIHFGIKIEGSTEASGGLGVAATIGAAWVAAKITVPLRILATLVLTPLIARLLKRVRKTPPPPAISG
jgi:hypothetical protein